MSNPRSLVSPQRRAICACGLVIISLFFTRFAAGAEIVVNGTDDLQAAIDRAVPGDTILLQAGATFTGDFVLPAKSGATYITIRSSATSGLPSSSQRTSPAYSSLLPKLQARTGPVLQTAAGSHHWRIENVEILPNPNRGSAMIALGANDNSQTNVSQVPHHIVLDRVYMHDDAGGSKRGIQLNSASTDVVNSYIAGIRRQGQESQGIGGWNGPGPFLIENNYIEGAGQSVMFGGADPDINGLIPSDIVIRGNHLSKPLSWRGGPWTIKTVLELKNAQRVTIDRNVIENSWTDGQNGYLVLFTGLNDGGGCSWCTVRDIVFTNNIVRHGNAGMQLSGHNSYLIPANIGPAGNNITIRNNLFYDIDRAWGGNAPLGVWFLIGADMYNVTIDHNTVEQSNDGNASVLVSSTQPLTGINIKNNFFNRGTYGVFAGGAFGEGTSTISGMLLNGVFQKNVIVDEVGSPPSYPSQNEFTSLAKFNSQFRNAGAGDYGLLSNSPYKNAGTDGLDIGVNMDTLPGGTTMSTTSGSTQVTGPSTPRNVRIVVQ